jgi:hypothetical protein
MQKNIKHICPSCSGESKCYCKMCKTSKNQQLCLLCFEKHKTINMMNKHIILFDSIKTIDADDYDMYQKIYSYLKIFKLEKSSLSKLAQECLERTD